MPYEIFLTASNISKSNRFQRIFVFFGNVRKWSEIKQFTTNNWIIFEKSKYERKFIWKILFPQKFTISNELNKNKRIINADVT